MTGSDSENDAAEGAEEEEGGAVEQGSEGEAEEASPGSGGAEGESPSPDQQGAEDGEEEDGEREAGSAKGSDAGGGSELGSPESGGGAAKKVKRRQASGSDGEEHSEEEDDEGGGDSGEGSPEADSPSPDHHEADGEEEHQPEPVVEVESEDDFGEEDEAEFEDLGEDEDDGPEERSGGSLEEGQPARSSRIVREEEESMADVFILLTKGRPKISAADLARPLQALGAKLDLRVMREALVEIGAGGAGLTQEAFVKAITSYLSRADANDDLSEIFRLAGGSKGRLSAYALAEAVQKMGGHLTKEEAEGLVSYARGVDGMLEYDQFVQLLTPPWGVS